MMVDSGDGWFRWERGGSCWGLVQVGWGGVVEVSGRRRVVHVGGGVGGLGGRRWD